MQLWSIKYYREKCFVKDSSLKNVFTQPHVVPNTNPFLSLKHMKIFFMKPELNVHSTKTSMFQTVHNEIVEVIYMLNWKWLEQTPHYSNRPHPYIDSSTPKSTNMLCNTSTAPFMREHAPFSWLATGVLRSNQQCFSEITYCTFNPSSLKRKYHLI